MATLQFSCIRKALQLKSKENVFVGLVIEAFQGAGDPGGNDHRLWQPGCHGPHTHLPWQVNANVKVLISFLGS